MSKLTRRDTLQLGAGALAGATLLRPRWTGAQNYAVKDVAPPELSIEDGASLRVVRPSKFVAGDEEVFTRDELETMRWSCDSWANHSSSKGDSNPFSRKAWWVASMRRRDQTDQ